MRLICPNCDAQYEIDVRAIPEGGRDVQCSSCGHAWFATTEPSQPVSEDDAFERELTRALGDDAEYDSVTADKGPAPHLNDDIASVLREEADRELQARQAMEAEAESAQVEEATPDTAPDTAGPQEEDTGNYKSEMAQRRASLSARVAHLRGHDETYSTSGDAQDLKGRAVLPDVDEISSTLETPRHSQNEQLVNNGIVVSSARASFRKGFTMVVTVSAAIFALYAFAPRIGEMVPQLKPMLDIFTNILDGLRSVVADWLSLGIDKIKQMLASNSA